jgi:mannose/cellobiose epimerase-like protein (N-acyl-D-glucosamine 2-epimerase family)
MHSFVQALTVAGNVTAVNPQNRSFTLQCRTGDVVEVFVGPTTNYAVLTNIDNLDRNRVLEPEGRRRDEDPVGYDLEKYVGRDGIRVVEGLYQEDGDRRRFEARTVHLFHSEDPKCLFFETHWWLDQIARMADRWLDDLFDSTRSYRIDDFKKFYRTNLNIQGEPGDDTIQECATLSRLIYGLSSAYLLTGAERYLLAAKAGVEYQREAFRSLSHDGRRCFWAFGRRQLRDGEKLVIPSENPDDRNTIPLYEQIYALAGLAQYYRITLDWEVLEDIRRTVGAFQDFYLDDEPARQKGFPGLGGYFSHIDYTTLRPDTPGLGDNRLRKNWNSVGDHIPAYLINLVLALDPVPKSPGKRHLQWFLDRCRGILEETSDLIVEKFPDPESDYVQERFMADWTPDRAWRWQQDRAICGHNLKIAWNLTRCAFYFQCQEKANRDRRDVRAADAYKERADKCIALARKLGQKMAEVGVDKLRGGVFDAVERRPANGQPTQFAWSSTKDFWQQEQGILAFLILHGLDPKERQFLDLAREAIAFWNIFFLDRDRQGIFFRTTDNGQPFVQGSYANKGGHSISGYHAFELNYLAHLYIRSYVISDARDDNNFTIYFKLSPLRDQESINVLPDFFPPGLLRIVTIRMDGVDRTDDLKPGNPDDFQIAVPLSDREIELQVEFASRPA